MNSGGTAVPPPGLVAQLERARRLGFLGPGPIEDHIEHAHGFVDALRGVDGVVGDLGCGGGVPGLVVALARPDLSLVLMDAQEKRTAFLDEAVVALRLGDRVNVVQGRAEAIGRGPHRGTLDAVLARGFGPPAVTAECAAPLLRPSGLLVVSEPPEPADRWPAAPLLELGLVARPLPADGPRIQVLELVGPCPDRYPRRDGVPAKRPLFPAG